MKDQLKLTIVNKNTDLPQLTSSWETIQPKPTTGNNTTKAALTTLESSQASLKDSPPTLNRKTFGSNKFLFGLQKEDAYRIQQLESSTTQPLLNRKIFSLRQSYDQSNIKNRMKHFESLANDLSFVKSSNSITRNGNITNRNMRNQGVSIISKNASLTSTQQRHRGSQKVLSQKARRVNLLGQLQQRE